MSKTGLVQIDRILAPISEDSPCGKFAQGGEDAELYQAYVEIQNRIYVASKIERARESLELLDSKEISERKRDYEGTSDDPSNNPKWESIAVDCAALLEQHSKDLKVAGWWLESMVRSRGFWGMSDALNAIASLVEKWGFDLHPHDPDDSMFPLSTISKMAVASGVLNAIDRVRVSSEVPVCFASKTWAVYIARIGEDERMELENQGYLTDDKIDTEFEKADVASLRDFVESLDSAIAEAKRLDAAIKLHFPEGGVRGLLARLNDAKSWFSVKLPQQASNAASNAVPNPSSSTTTNPENTSNPAGGPSLPPAVTATAIPHEIRTREEALKSLLRVAEFFRKTEPHSPLSYSLEQAVRWGRMPLPDLLRELVRSEEVLTEVFRRMGIEDKRDD